MFGTISKLKMWNRLLPNAIRRVFCSSAQTKVHRGAVGFVTAVG